MNAYEEAAAADEQERLEAIERCEKLAERIKAWDKEDAEHLKAMIDELEGEDVGELASYLDPTSDLSTEEGPDWLWGDHIWALDKKGQVLITGGFGSGEDGVDDWEVVPIEECAGGKPSETGT